MQTTVTNIQQKENHITADLKCEKCGEEWEWAQLTTTNTPPAIPISDLFCDSCADE